MQIGKTNSTAKQGQNVSVHLNGKTVTAKAGNEINTNKVALIKDDQGQLTAFSPGTKTEQQSIEISAKRGKAPPTTLYPIKVLFTVEREDINEFEYWLGGDRPLPLKIFSLPYRLRDQGRGTQITNTGTGLDDWVAQISWFDSQVPFPKRPEYSSLSQVPAQQSGGSIITALVTPAERGLGGSPHERFRTETRIYNQNGANPENALLRPAGWGTATVKAPQTGLGLQTGQGRFGFSQLTINSPNPIRANDQYAAEIFFTEHTAYQLTNESTTLYLVPNTDPQGQTRTHKFWADLLIETPVGGKPLQTLLDFTDQSSTILNPWTSDLPQQELITRLNEYFNNLVTTQDFYQAFLPALLANFDLQDFTDTLLWGNSVTSRKQTYLYHEIFRSPIAGIPAMNYIYFKPPFTEEYSLELTNRRGLVNSSSRVMFSKSNAFIKFPILSLEHGYQENEASITSLGTYFTNTYGANHTRLAQDLHSIDTTQSYEIAPNFVKTYPIKVLRYRSRIINSNNFVYPPWQESRQFTELILKGKNSIIVRNVTEQFTNQYTEGSSFTGTATLVIKYSMSESFVLSYVQDNQIIEVPLDINSLPFSIRSTRRNTYTQNYTVRYSPLPVTTSAPIVAQTSIPTLLIPTYINLIGNKLLYVDTNVGDFTGSLNSSQRVGIRTFEITDSGQVVDKGSPRYNLAWLKAIGSRKSIQNASPYL